MYVVLSLQNAQTFFFGLRAGGLAIPDLLRLSVMALAA